VEKKSLFDPLMIPPQQVCGKENLRGAQNGFFLSRRPLRNKSVKKQGNLCVSLQAAEKSLHRDSKRFSVIF
jgi:hypothetical protein